MIRIGVIGGSSSLIKMLNAATKEGVEIVDVAKVALEREEAVYKLKEDGLEDLSVCPTWTLRGSGKSGSNKSDRKRNRKNRWR